jgi:hypothetical protein
MEHGPAGRGRGVKPLLMQVKFDVAGVDLAEEGNEILQRTPKPTVIKLGPIPRAIFFQASTGKRPVSNDDERRPTTLDMQRGHDPSIDW